MLRSTYQLTRQLSASLLQFPGIVRGFERKSPRALPDLLAWIDRAEESLSGHRLVAAAEVAGFRARVIAPAFDDDRRGTLRRRQSAIAVALLHELQAAVQAALHPHAARIEQARDIARQLLHIVANSGAIVYDPATRFEDLVDAVWALCSTHEQLRPYAAQLRMLLNADDIRMLLAEEIDPADFARSGSMSK